MKKTALFCVFLFGMTSFQQIPENATRCDCGSFETGITQYYVLVEEGRGCCTSTLVTTVPGARKTYLLREGVYYENTTTPIQASQAQRICCPNP